MAPSTDIKYDKLMRIKSIWKNTHIAEPKVLNTETFAFPLDSTIHWFRCSQTIDNPSSKIGYLRNNKFLVETILEYPKEGTIGKFAYVASPNATKIIKDASKEVKEFRWLKPTESIRVNPKIQLLYTYGALLSKYKYSEQIMRRYNMYYNNFLSMMDRLIMSKRNIFLVMDLPSKLLSKRDLERLSTKLTNNLLNMLPTTAYFNLLELWKFICPIHHKNSLLCKLPPYVANDKDDSVLSNRPMYLDKSYWNKINLLLVIDTKCILVNLYTLMSFIEEWNIEVKGITPIKYKTFMNKFLDMLQFVIDNAALTEAELEENEDARDESLVVANSITGNAIVVNKPTDDTAVVTQQPTTEPGATTILDKGEDDLSELDEDPGLELDLPDEDRFDQDASTGEEFEEYSIDSETLTGIELKDEMDITNDFKDLDDLMKQEYKYDTVSSRIEKMKENKSISKKKYEVLKKTIEEQPNKKSPYKDMKDQKLGDILDDSKDKYTVEESDTKITDNISVLDKSYNTNTVATLNKDYIKNQYKKDIIRSVYALQNSNVVIEDYEVNELDSILGTIEEHTIKLNSLDGTPTTIKLNLPKVNEDGEITMSSNTYKIRAQRADIPIRKIDFNKVMLSSYYGKLSIYKAKTNYENIGYWLMNTIVKLTNDIDIKNLVLLPIKNPDVKLPLDYTHFSRFIKSFSYKGMSFLFDYSSRLSLFKNKTEEDLEEIEDGVVVIGAKGENAIVMDFENRVFIQDGKKYKEIENLYDMLKIDRGNSPIEFASVNIIKKTIPMVVILGYYIGLEELFKLLNVKYTFMDRKSRDIHKYSQYVIPFKDRYVLINRDHGKADLILSGLLAIDKITKELPFNIFNDKAAYSVVFTKLNIAILYFNEIKLLETMFVDPMTLTLLKQLKEPTSFKGLLVKSAELLVDDSYTNSTGIDGMVIKGYERVAGLMYKELVTALKDHENRTFFSKSKLAVNPYAVMNKITEDSTTVLVDDLNPMASIKQNEDVSMLGAFGRSKDAMNRDTRGMTDAEIGVISEGAKDNGEVGISAYLSADPNIANTRGMIGEKQKTDNWANIVSSSALLAPFSLTDDSKRFKN